MSEVASFPGFSKPDCRTDLTTEWCLMIVSRLSAAIVFVFPLSICPVRNPVQAEPVKFANSQLVSGVDKKLDVEIKDLVAIYQELHASPELSLMEEKTAARLAKK